MTKMLVDAKLTKLSLGGGQTADKNHIWQGIGIEIDTLPDHLALGDVGMESILAVEMQQRIEREYEVNLTTGAIKKITVGMIKQFLGGTRTQTNEYSTKLTSCCLDNESAISNKLIEFKKSLK